MWRLSVPDKNYSSQEIQDRFAIEDLYDRQLAAAELFDFEQYDTTFADDAKLDLSDFGLEPCGYPEYRSWLASMKEMMVSSQRITGGLRLQLDGDEASTCVPVVCHVKFRMGDSTKLVHTGIFYHDKLERREQSWRIVKRRESLNWSA
jgi:hypothetical protein